MDDMEEAVVAGAAAAAHQGDLAEVVARAGAMAMAAAASHHHHRRRPPSPSHSSSPSSPSPGAADHSPHIVSPSAARRAAAGQQIMLVPSAACYDEGPQPARPAACDNAVMFDAPSSAMAAVDPYHLLSSSAPPPPPPPHGGHWLPPLQQISQHACYGVPMGGDADGDEPMMMGISPLTTPPPSHYQSIKRKNEVKKVVCIPALPPAAASSRPGGGGEVIPSDLWAWRKYGQKPIKGSPYPRGYYRCSSSKGCMARKQVERSRSDPNMLVITYTAEHNHPWPMQRNVLAGYSRPHTTHNMSNCKKKNSCSSRVEPMSGLSCPTSSSSSKHANYSERNAVVPISSNTECQQSNMMEDNTAGYVAAAYTIDTCVAMNQPINCNSMQPSDEVFAELEELEHSNPMNANIYSRGVSYEWQRF